MAAMADPREYFRQVAPECRRLAEIAKKPEIKQRPAIGFDDFLEGSRPGICRTCLARRDSQDGQGSDILARGGPVVTRSPPGGTPASPLDPRRPGPRQ